MGKRGVDVLLYSNTGTDAVPVWTLVGGQRGATLSESNETIETTNKTSTGMAKEYEYGFYGWSISCDGVHANGDLGYTTLQDALRNKTKLKVQIKDSNYTTPKTFTGSVLVTKLDQENGHDGESTYKLDLQGTGTLTAA
jgi:TP901-1 family phage major tail protein